MPHIPEDGLTMAEGIISTPAQYAALTEMMHNEGLRYALAGQNFLDKYEATESAEYLEQAIEFWEKAVEHIPQNDPDPDVRCSRLTMLGGAYGFRYQRTGSTRDLQRAIELTTDAIDFMAECPLVSDYLDFLAASYSGLESWLSQRFLRFGSTEDLHEAVDAAEMAVNLTPPDSSDWPGRMNDLGLRLGDRSQHDASNSKEDLDRAINCLEMAVDSGASLCPDDQDVRLDNLGRHLGTRFKNRGAVEDLERSVEVLEKALYKSAPNRSLRCSILHNLAIVLVELYEHHGTDQDLDRAIDMTRTAIDETPEGHPDGVERAVNLGLWLSKRAVKTGSMEDITRSIDAIQAEIKAIPKDHTVRPRLLMGLAGSLDALSQRTSSALDLEYAIEAAKEALSSTPPGHHLRAGYLNNLACKLGRRAECYPLSPGTQHGSEAESSDPFDEAIAAIKASIDATEEGDVDRPSRLCNLGDLLGKRFARNGYTNADDINACIEATRQAVDTSPRASHQRAIILQNLGIWLLARHGLNGVVEDETDALHSFKEGWKSQNAAPFVRVTLAREAAEILASRSNWKEADELLEEAIDLLPSIIPRSLQHTDKQDMLAKYTGLASMAAAIALNAGKSAYDTLKLLELGRGVIASLLLDMRGDISDLKAQHPSLATAFFSLRDELDSPPNVPAAANTARDVSIWELQNRKRRETEEKFSELVGEIQSLSGFRHFCGTPDAEELKVAAGSGPIAVINVSHYRCDAFLIQRDNIRVLQLPDLTMQEVQQRLRTLRESPTGHIANMAAVLEWLWTSITRPCLDALKLTRPMFTESLEEWPRIWWIPTGALSQFPLHAAGRHWQRREETVLDRAMSSYALSLRSLIHGRRYPLPTGLVKPSNNRALLLAMSTTPGLERGGRLHWAQQEVNMVVGLCPELHLEASTPEPRKDEVLADLQSCKIFHFAGHGQSDATEPSKSCLLLRDWQTSPLTVADFRDSRLQDQDAQPFLGYLSACSTGANEAARLADEGIHLISSLQLAGFRHVVGTLWEVSDQHCVDVARVFYETLRDEGMTDEAVCQGLHRATRALRDRSFSGEIGRRKAFCIDDGIARRDLMDYHWVPYVHFGI